MFRYILQHTNLSFYFWSSLRSEDNILCFCFFTIFLKKFKLRQSFQIVTDVKTVFSRSALCIYHLRSSPEGIKNALISVCCFPICFCYFSIKMLKCMQNMYFVLISIDAFSRFHASKFWSEGPSAVGNIRVDLCPGDPGSTLNANKYFLFLCLHTQFIGDMKS